MGETTIIAALLREPLVELAGLQRHKLREELRALLADRDAWKAKAEGYSDIVERGAKHWLDLQNTHQIAWEGALDDAMAAACTEIKSLAVQAGALEKERDMYRDAYEKDIGNQRPEAPARRLRAVQFDGYDDWYRWNDGTLEALVGNPPRWKVQKHIRTEWIEAVAALRDDPWEKVETLEGVVCSAVREWNDTAHKTGADCSELVANAVRAWLAQQPAPELTAAQHVEALVGMGARSTTPYMAWVCGDASPVSDKCADMLWDHRHDHILVLPPEATP